MNFAIDRVVSSILIGATCVVAGRYLDLSANVMQSSIPPSYATLSALTYDDAVTEAIALQEIAADRVARSQLLVVDRVRRFLRLSGNHLSGSITPVVSLTQLAYVACALIGVCAIPWNQTECCCVRMSLVAGCWTSPACPGSV